MGKPLVKNAADEKQVARGRETAKDQRDRELTDLATVLQFPEGRRVFWRLMAKCRTYESIMETSARIYYNAGQQDFGHFLFGEVTEADPKAMLRMMQEAGKIEWTAAALPDEDETE